MSQTLNQMIETTDQYIEREAELQKRQKQIAGQLAKLTEVAESNSEAIGKLNTERNLFIGFSKYLEGEVVRMGSKATSIIQDFEQRISKFIALFITLDERDQIIDSGRRIIYSFVELDKDKSSLLRTYSKELKARDFRNIQLWNLSKNLIGMFVIIITL